MTHSDNKRILPSEVPCVKSLCHSAGFEGASRHELRKSTLEYAQHWYIRSGILGSDLKDWRSKKVRCELGLMAQQFLDVGGYGDKYWGASAGRVLEYPRDKNQIIEVLRQLFWCQASIAAKNAQRKSQIHDMPKTALSDQDSTARQLNPASGHHRFIGFEQQQAGLVTPPPRPRSIRYFPPDVSRPTTDWSSVKRGALRLISHRQPTVSDYGGLPSPFTPANSEIRQHGDGAWYDTTCKSQDSPWNQPQAYFSPNTHTGLQSRLAGIPADAAGFPGGLSLQNSGLMQTAEPKSSQASNNGAGIDECALLWVSNRKRSASQQPEALYTTSKSTKHKDTTEGSGVIALSDEESDELLASTTRWRHRRSPVIKVEDAFKSRLNTPTSRPPEAGMLDPGVLEDSDDGELPSLPNERSLEAADKTPYHSGSVLNASDHDHSAMIGGSVVEEHDPPSRPSPIAPSTATREQSRHASKPKVQIQYRIITAYIPRLSYTVWLEGTLRNKTLGEIFDVVAKYTSEKHVQKIVFELSTSQAEPRYPMRRNDENTFKDMRREFNGLLRFDRDEEGITEFRIWLAPDPPEQWSTEIAVVGGSESEDEIV